MVSTKMTDLGLTEKHLNVAAAALIAGSADGTIDWDRFLHFSGYGTIGSAKKTMQNTKKEIKELLEKAGMNQPNGNGDNDEATTVAKPKKSVKPKEPVKPKKRKAAGAAAPAAKKAKAKGGFKAVNKEEDDDEADIFGELIKNDKSAAVDAEDQIKDEEPVASAPEELC